MTRSRAMRKLLLWTAALAVLMAALAPTLSQAMQAARGRDASDWFYVCSVLGAKWVSADDSGTAPRGDSGKGHSGDHVFEHCPYCSMHAVGAGLPPHDLRVPALSRVHEAIGHYIAAAPTRKPWSDALSRGPPTNA